MMMIKSKIIPILDQSDMPKENEIILPPFSILKIIRVDEYVQAYSNDVFKSVTAIFIGSVYQDFVNTLKETKTESYVIESKTKDDRTEVYDPKGKFQGTKDTEILKKAAEFVSKSKK